LPGEGFDGNPLADILCELVVDGADDGNLFRLEFGQRFCWGGFLFAQK
jgi:hypothetical protein